MLVLLLLFVRVVIILLDADGNGGVTRCGSVVVCSIAGVVVGVGDAGAVVYGVGVECSRTHITVIVVVCMMLLMLLLLTLLLL